MAIYCTRKRQWKYANEEWKTDHSICVPSEHKNIFINSHNQQGIIHDGKKKEEVDTPQQ